VQTITALKLNVYETTEDKSDDTEDEITNYNGVRVENFAT
jgi:hypothetical protein